MVTRTISVWQQLSGGNNQIVAGISNNGTTITYPLSSQDIDSKDPQIQIDQNGDALVIWNSDNRRVTSSRYSKINNTWSDPVDIYPNGTFVDEMNPQLAMSPDGNAMAVWVFRTTEAKKIIGAAIYTKATTSNGGWATILTISATDSNNTSPRVAIDSNGNSIVVWEYLNAETGMKNIKSKYYTRSNSNWSGITDVTNSSDNVASQSPQIAMNNNRAWAVWTKGDIVQTSKYTVGSGWTDQDSLSESGKTSTTPQIAIDPSNNAIAIWSLRNEVDSENQYTTIQAIYNNGTNWSITSIKNISTNDANNRSPKIVFNSSGNAIAIWCSGQTQIYSNFFTKSTGWPSGWSNQISVGTGESILDVIIDLDDSNNAAATWQSYNIVLGWTEIFTSYFTKTGDSWSTAKSISVNTLPSTNPQIVIDQSGNTTSTTTIPVNLSITQQYVNNNTFPVTIPSGVTSIKVVEDIVTNKLVNFVIQSGSSVTVNGQGHTITLNGVTNYPGLIKSSSRNTIVRNVGVLSTDINNRNALKDFCGWIGSDGFVGEVDTCYSVGMMGGKGSGGIVGAEAGETIITNCYSSGALSNEGCGGIVGSNAGIGGVCTITNCYTNASQDSFGLGCGGIAGGYAFKCHIKNCYTTSNVSGNPTGFGTIFGNFTGSRSGADCKISNCYTAGLNQLIYTVTGPDGIQIVSGSTDKPEGTVTNPTIQGYTLNNNLTFGQTGADVSTLQTILIQLGQLVLPPGVEKGYFGLSTRAAVKAYQAANGISPANGYVGAVTRASLNAKTGTIVVANTTISGSNSYSAVLTTYVNFAKSLGWNDDVAYSVLDTAFFKVSPGGPDTLNGPDTPGITNVPFKLLAFLYSASTSQLFGPILTYSNIWSMASLASVPTITSANITNNSGVNLQTTTGYELSTDGRSITFNFSEQFTSVPTPYCLLINDIYVDKFELVSTTTIFFRLIGDFYTVIVDANSESQFIQATKTALATALGISEDLIQILALSEGSIAVQALVPESKVDALGNIISSGQFTVNYDGKSYPAIPDSFSIIDTRCFHKDTLILTPGGYRKVQDLSRGDLVKTAQGREVPIKRMISFIGTYEKCPLYVIQKDALAPNVPLKDLYMSDGHAFRNGGNWYHMKCSDLASKVDLQSIEYYNIVLYNYIDNTLVANGVEVESLFDMKGLKMHWRCEKKCCKPVIERE
jgi:peptidoglycan hydrolase-like protein with peptidoglycan-binding domain